jgi:DNA-binding response OmpR family regulator
MNPAAPKHPTALVVDDEPMIRTLVATFLQEMGLRVVEASNGLEALRKTRQEGNRPDIVVSDLLMPEMGGLQLLKELRLDQPEVAVLFISGFCDDYTGLTAAMDDRTRFLEKPFDFRLLAAHIESLLPQLAPTATAQRSTSHWERQPPRQKARPQRHGS